MSTLAALKILTIVLNPILYMWAWNTLFPSVQIPMGWDTWAATTILTSVFYTSSKTSTNS